MNIAHFLKTGLVIAFLLAGRTRAEIIPADRCVTWQGNVGVPGGIPDRAKIYQTFSAGAQLSEVQTALRNCPPNQVVKLGAGTYRWSEMLDWQSVNQGVVLRGSVDPNGAPATKIIWSGGYIYMRSVFDESALSVDVDLSKDALKGSTKINLVSMPSWIVPGHLYILDQVDDPALVTAKGQEGGESYRAHMGGGDRGMAQLVKVLSKTAKSITIEIPLYHEFATKGKAQIAEAGYDPSSSVPRRNCGIENLYMEGQYADGDTRFIRMENCDGCWVKNVNIYNQPGGVAINTDFCYRCEIRDSFIHYSHAYGGGQGYGVALYNVTSASLVENNILEHLHVAMGVDYGASGNVFGYNYEFHGFADSKQQPAIDSHGTHTMMNLWEGNYCEDKVLFDVIHGSGSDQTVFRNRILGWQAGNTYDQVAVEIDMYNRRCNVVGNILGLDKKHTIYEAVAPDNSYRWDRDRIIYVLGYGESLGYDDAATLDVIRLDNYNTVNHGIPDREAIGGAILPNSYYLSTKPAWFGDHPWPPFDPASPADAVVKNLPASDKNVFGVHP